LGVEEEACGVDLSVKGERESEGEGRESFLVTDAGISSVVGCTVVAVVSVCIC